MKWFNTGAWIAKEEGGTREGITRCEGRGTKVRSMKVRGTKEANGNHFGEVNQYRSLNSEEWLG